MSAPEPSAAPAAPAGSLRIGYPPGLSPDKWLRRMAGRFPAVQLDTTLVDVGRAQLGQTPELLADEFDVVFVREPAEAPRSAPEGLARIPLYTEDLAVLVPRDHEASLFSSLSLTELDGERWVDPVDALTSSSAEVEMHIELVAANVGLGLLPLPLARAYSRRDVVVIPLDEPARTRMGIAWLPGRGDEDEIAGFVGIVQGRTERTSRGPEPTPRGGSGARSKDGQKSKGASGAVGRRAGSSTAKPRSAKAVRRGPAKGRRK
ncbi:MAG TPA: LysR family transcriptional regulator substrate-binding protein [Dietzia timorensis]|uniref:LysR family transcriptional regulator substrate-binding protein n=1 Tax=Dietzia timorensis TaxID=499555 RepID=A0A921F581_9ACTN|nr:LysR family transcriptional regulator substrate-binding protein [Dietzia timorensis]HJE91840.1 LysR family transcriptional regulator substrate-binding protein [Dietzia timorensis]